MKINDSMAIKNLFVSITNQKSWPFDQGTIRK